VNEPGQVLNVVADAGYSNGKQAEACEAKGIISHVPANREKARVSEDLVFQCGERMFHGRSSQPHCRWRGPLLHTLERLVVQVPGHQALCTDVPSSVRPRSGSARKKGTGCTMPFARGLKVEILA